MFPALSFIGRHDVGKTTLLTKLISLFSERAYKVGVVKHAHKDIHITADKDSEKLFLAGANQVYLSSPNIVINYQRQAVEKSLKAIYEEIPKGNMDLILVEGFKEELLPKIEVIREDINPIPIFAPNTIAFVTDIPIKTELPIFGFNEIEQLLEFIVDYFNLPTY